MVKLKNKLKCKCILPNWKNQTQTNNTLHFGGHQYAGGVVLPAAEIHTDSKELHKKTNKLGLYSLRVSSSLECLLLAKLNSKWDLETYERPHIKDVTIHHSLMRAPLQLCPPSLCRRTSQGVEWGWQILSPSSGEAPAAAPTNSNSNTHKHNDTK